jgi:hypothetical protein
MIKLLVAVTIPYNKKREFAVRTTYFSFGLKFLMKGTNKGAIAIGARKILSSISPLSERRSVLAKES